MTLKDFVLSCTSNTIEIEVLDKHDNILFEGALKLVLHIDDSVEDQHNKAFYSFEEREDILESKIEAWFLENDNTIDIRTDYERGYKNKI